MTAQTFAPLPPGQAVVYIVSMVSERQRIILADHARLPWRFFGQLATFVAGL